VICILVLVVTSASLGACGSDGGSDENEMVVVGTEMTFTAPDEVGAGEYLVTFRNDGAVPHELAFRDPSGQFVTRRSIAAASEATMEVELTPGTWQLECHELGHMNAGMHRPLAVTADAG
jgi:uncharacterized cupredoxin-like copper-binding protein